MSDLEISTFGGLSLARNGDELRLATRKATALLLYLALSPLGTRSRAQLAGLLWGRSAEQQARASLRQTLSSLRKALGEQADLIESSAEDIGIRRQHLRLDAIEFQALASSEQPDDLERAAELYAGEFLQGFGVRESAFEDWLASQRQQYHELALGVLQGLVRHYRRREAFDSALQHAQALLALDPLQEQSHLILMELYQRLGRREHALRQYGECERILWRELQLEPGPEIRKLQESIASNAPVTAEAPPPQSPPVSSKPGIAVLPFDNLSEDPSQQQLADAISEDIVSNLAHDLWFDVVARASTQQFRERKSGVAEIARVLGVRYLVDGSLRRSGDRIRVSVVLIDAVDARQIWSRRYQLEVTELFDMQDRVALSIAAAVIPELNLAEQRSAMRKHPQNLDAWSYCHKAFWHLYRFELAELELAQSLFEQAIALDPSYSQPHAGLAYSQMMYVWYDSSKRELLERANDNARHAIQLDQRDSYAHFALGRILSMQARYDDAVRELEMAIELNPSFGRAYFGLASVMVYAGRYRQAIEPIDTAIRLSPADPHLWTFYNIKARALTGLGRYAEAVDWAREALRQPSATFWSDLALISALGYSGEREAARLAIAELRLKKPGYSCAQYRRDDFMLAPAAHELMMEGLSRAGLARDDDEDSRNDLSD